MNPRLLRVAVWPEWRAHPWRQAMALLSVALGVALAWSVHLINASALAEFAGAGRAVQGEPDASWVCARRDGCDDAVIETLATRPEVALALPVVEIEPVLERQPGERPVHGAGIEVAEAEALGEAARNGALPGPGGAVDGDDHRSASESSMAKKSGKLTATRSAP